MSIIINHVDHIYDQNTSGEHYALRDVNLEIRDGEFIGVIGHTGSGKSTLVLHCNGLLKPTKGQILYNGEDISDKSYNLAALRQKVGLVFQYPEHQLFENTVFEDVCFGPKNMKLSKVELEKRAYEALEMVGIPEEAWESSPFNLSGGQKRRVAIAGVLAMSPEVLILDEPTAGLDPKGRDEILDLVSRLRTEKNITIILVSHSMEDVANYVDRIVVMDKGTVKMNDVPAEVFKRHSELEEMGLAAPEVTYIMQELFKGGLKVAKDATTVKEACASIIKAVRG